MKEKRNLTGYPSIDKPWLKYYSESQQSWDIPENSCFDNMYECNKNHLDDIAISYYGNNISYRNLFTQIEHTTQAFIKIGVQENDIVSFFCVDTPEFIYAFYALNKLGAVSNMIDPRNSAVACKKYITEVKSKYIVCLDVCLSILKESISDLDVEKVIVISPNDSLPFIAKTVQAVLHKQVVCDDDRCIKWKDFINNRDIDTPQTEGKRFDKNHPATIVHTGGTTGIPKGVLLSNYNMNAIVHEAKNTPLPLWRNSVFLNITVPFVAFGLGLGLHVPLCLGWKSVLVPDYQPHMMRKLMMKYKPQLVLGTETYFAPMLDYDKYDYSNTNAMLMGGMPTKESFEKRFNERILKDGGKFTVSKGYSMTEAGSMGTCSYTGVNEVGSNGIPLACTIVSAFDPDTGMEKKYRELGEICLCTPTMMMGYYKNEDATKAIIRRHSDGKDWIHSGDIGYITEDGFVYIVDRIKRMIIMSGFKIFPSEIENVILNHPDVVECSVVGLDDSVHDKVPCVFIKAKTPIEDKGKILSDFNQLITDAGLPSYYCLNQLFVVDDLPITSVGKIDYRKLEKRAQELVSAK